MPIRDLGADGATFGLSWATYVNRKAPNSYLRVYHIDEAAYLPPKNWLPLFLFSRLCFAFLFFSCAQEGWYTPIRIAFT